MWSAGAPTPTRPAHTLIEYSTNVAYERNHQKVYPEHIIYTALDDRDRYLGPIVLDRLEQAIKHAGGDCELFKEKLSSILDAFPVSNHNKRPICSKELQGIINQAQSIVRATAWHETLQYVNFEQIMMLIVGLPRITELLRRFNAKPDIVLQYLSDVREEGGLRSEPEYGWFVDRYHKTPSSISQLLNPNAARHWKNGEALAKFGTDMTKLANEGKYSAVIGREFEIRQVIRILSKRSKGNVMLLGEAGVGKTAMAKLLAQRMVDGNVPSAVQGHLYSLDLARLYAGAKYRGEYQERLRALLNDVERKAKQGTRVILFIDEIHMVMMGHGEPGMDAANLLKPILAPGQLQFIGATTLKGFREHIEKHAAFVRRFSQVTINEPNVEDTVHILRALGDKFERHHSVRIADGSFRQAAELAKRYLTTKRLPSSALDLVDEACTSAGVSREFEPFSLTKMQREKRKLQAKINSVRSLGDAKSRQQMEIANQALQRIEKRLHPLVQDQIHSKTYMLNLTEARSRLDRLVHDATEAEVRGDTVALSDLRNSVIPNMHGQIAFLEQVLEEDNVRRVALNTHIITPEAIADVVSRATKIPLSAILSSERVKLLNWEQTLSSLVVGQPEAVKAVADVLRVARSGLANPSRPIASFLLTGPTGTGKTHLATTLAKLLFDSPEAMVRIDSSEFSEKHAISRLIGAPPGYVGHDSVGMLTEFVRHQPYSIILVDEIDKACPEFITIWLQILDDGRFTDGHGRLVNFRNTLIIMTSNLGARHLEDYDGAEKVSPNIRRRVMESVEGHFPPEFINRLNGVVVFRPLAADAIRSIVDLRLAELQKRLDKKRLTLDIDDVAKKLLILRGQSTKYGARVLFRMMEEQIMESLSERLVRDQIQEGEIVRVRLKKPGDRLKVLLNHRGIDTPAIKAMGLGPRNVT